MRVATVAALSAALLCPGAPAAERAAAAAITFHKLSLPPRGRR